MDKLGQFGQIGQQITDQLGGQQAIGDFVSRFRQGPDAISDEEASDRYGQIAQALPPDQFQQAAQGALAQLSPDQRAQFAETLRSRAHGSQASAAGLDQSDAPERARQDPGFLAGATTQLHQQEPGLLQGLLGQGGSNPIAKTVLSGIVAFAAQRFLGAR